MDRQKRPAQKRKFFDRPLMTLTMTMVVFVCYMLYVNNLGGITFDTVFLAAYFAMLTVFIIEAFAHASGRWGRY